MTECRRLSLQNVGVLIQFLFLLIVLFIVTHKFVFSGQLFYPIYKSLHWASQFAGKKYCLTNIYLFKVNDKNTRKRCKIRSKLTIKLPERRLTYFTPFFIVPIVDSEQVNICWVFEWILIFICVYSSLPQLRKGLDPTVSHLFTLFLYFKCV